MNPDRSNLRVGRLIGRSCERPSGYAVSMIACLLIVYLTIGGNFLGFHVAVETVPPFIATTVRALVGGLLLLGIRVAVRRSRGSGGDGPVTWDQWRAVVVQAVLLLVIGQGSVAWSLQQLPPGTTAILASSMPIWVALLSLVYLRRPLSRAGVAGVAVGFVGLGMLSLVRDGGGIGMTGSAVVPALVVLAGAIATAAGVMYGQRATVPLDGLFGAALQLICAGVLLGVLALITGEVQRFEPAAVSTSSWLALFYLIVFGSIVGYAALIWLTEHVAPALAASFAYVGPVVALALSAGLLDEHIGPAKIVAATLALLGAALMARGRSSPGAPEPVVNASKTHVRSATTDRAEA